MFLQLVRYTLFYYLITPIRAARIQCVKSLEWTQESAPMFPISMKLKLRELQLCLECPLIRNFMRSGYSFTYEKRAARKFKRKLGTCCLLRKVQNLACGTFDSQSEVGNCIQGFQSDAEGLCRKSFRSWNASFMLRCNNSAAAATVKQIITEFWHLKLRSELSCIFCWGCRKMYCTFYGLNLPQLPLRK